MKRLADRGAMLLVAGTAAVAAVTGAAPAQSADISGTVQFAGGGVIPEGRIEIYIRDSAIKDNGPHSAAGTRIESDGKSKAIDFSFSPPASSPASRRPQIVALLERADGWLLARGSAVFEAGSPVDITLYTVMY